ncbi:MAG TPA: CRISPR-associated endonuclease Cas2 [Candidatus Paceibacterota bacterium]
MINKLPKIKSPLKQKVLLLLTTGVLLGLTRSPKQYFKIVHMATKEWKFIDRQYLYRLIGEFREKRLIDYQEKANGEIKIIITERGKLFLLNYDIDNMKIKKSEPWDGKWRVVFFDIPEKHRRARDALREKLKEIGFRELQQSVFIQPYPCFEEINFLIEFFEVRKWVLLAEIDQITNEAQLLIRFNLNKN